MKSPCSSPTLDALYDRILAKRYRAFEYEALGLFHQSRELFEAAAELEAEARKLSERLPYLPAAKRRKKAQYGCSPSRHRASAA